MDPDDAVMTFLRYLRHRGLHVTSARERVARAASVIDGHFEAGDLWAELRANGTSTAPATVYRTLSLMVDAGVLRRLEIDEGAQYDSVASAMSLRSISWKIGQTVGPLGVGLIKEYVGTTEAFLTASAFIVFATGLFWLTYTLSDDAGGVDPALTD